MLHPAAHSVAPAAPAVGRAAGLVGFEPASQSARMPITGTAMLLPAKAAAAVSLQQAELRPSASLAASAAPAVRVVDWAAGLVSVEPATQSTRRPITGTAMLLPPKAAASVTLQQSASWPAVCASAFTSRLGSSVDRAGGLVGVSQALDATAAAGAGLTAALPLSGLDMLLFSRADVSSVV